ncbi:hypothetical protein K1T71_002630 [Dendrolimus kikuchii]|uniref:Uncharacterized protein n=1 Tax=Dendrolimus kikuchii TaxID=765133 RepID=A0ACC1DD79_9NEOP|nr:hypothetical protein K1T71_002630 [Dendrolimus kikuchii]
MGYMKIEKSSDNQTSLYDRIKKLLVSYEWSDCSFSVSGQIFKAHKLILGISSPVFEAMFYGPLSSNENIEITDIQPDIFQLLINYIYTDTVELTSVEQAFELLYASRKYLLEQLSDMCIAYIQANISVDNVIEVLNYPDFMHDKQLISFSMKLFCEHANYLLQEKKNLISHLCMKAILETDKINISEKGLIMHVFKWTLSYCEQNDIKPTVENRHDLLCKFGLFKLLRFLTVSLEEFEEIVADPNNLLFPIEVETIRKKIKGSVENEKIEVLSNTTVIPRNVLKLQWFICYRSPLRSVAPITIDANNYVIHSRMKANKSVFINSLCIPTRMAPAVCFRNNSTKVYSEQLSVSVMCESDDNVLTYTNFMNTVEYNSIVNIELTEPCFIKKDLWYKISFVWPHNRFPSHSYVVEFRDKLYTGNKITFEFDDLPINSRNAGSFLGGLKFCL